MKLAPLLTAAALVVAGGASAFADEIVVSYGSEICMKEKSNCSYSRVEVPMKNFYGISLDVQDFAKLNEYIQIEDEDSVIPAYTWIYTG